jgi:radical SAM protein with 4Fe4S-binding SPASM domain
MIDDEDDGCSLSNLLPKPCKSETGDHIFASCINARRSFHIDPYGQTTFCSFIKDPSLRYDLRNRDFKTCWEEFIPSLIDEVRGGNEYQNNCGSCELKDYCKWCPVYGYLEHRRYTAKVEYLCDIARKNREFKKRWCEKHRRYYQIAGITIQVDSDLPITDTTFHPKFKLFQVDKPGKDIIYMRHHFFIPHLDGQYLGKEVYRRPPWVIYKKENYWLYVGISPTVGEQHIHQLVVFNHDHTQAKIFNHSEEIFHSGNLHSLTLLPTDQLLLARVLAHRKGCYFHSSGVIFEGSGFLFVGHSEAGKSTIVKMLENNVEILCDDRIIVRKWPTEFRIHGTWSHGDISDVSADSAPLKAIFFLEKAQKNHFDVLGNKQEIVKRLLACLIKPFVTADWWDTMLSLVENIVHEVPCYTLYFDTSGKVIDLLKQI